MHKRKSVPIHSFKALADEGPGVFEAIVSVFGNVDFAGDRVVFGAFTKTLSTWLDSGDPIPVIFSHQWDDLDAHVGVVLEAKELPAGDPLLAGTPIAELGGLWIKARMDVEDPDEDFARRLFKRLEQRRIKEFSFAYDVVQERRAPDGANDLIELEIIEVGPTLKGMNPATELLAAKALTGAELSPEHRTFVEGVIANLRALEATDLADQLEKALGTSIPPHAFIPKDDDPTRCTVCGLTRSTVGHLNTLSSDPDGAKRVSVELAGSAEERQGRLLAAGFDTIDLTLAEGGFYDLALEGSFADRVVFRLEGWDDPVGGGLFFECAIEAETPEVVLGEPVAVEIEASVRPKTATARSTKARLDVATMRGEGDGSGKTKRKAEDPGRGKAEDAGSRTGTGSSTGEASRVLLELDELELSS